MTRSRFIIVAAGLVGATALAMYSFSKGEPETKTAGEAIVAVTVPELTADQREGEALFQANCGSCHGQAAAGQDGVAPPLVHKIYEPGHHADGAFFLAAKNGVRQHHWPFGNMPPVEGVSQTEVTKIVAYVRALQRANGIY